MLLLHLCLDAPETSLRAPLVSVRGGQLQSQLLVPAPSDSEGLVGLLAKVIRKSSLVKGILHPLFGCENLLDGLHKGNENTP